MFYKKSVNYIFFLFLLAAIVEVQGQVFTFSGSFATGEVIDVSVDGKKAVAIYTVSSPSVDTRLASFDPVTGTIFDTKSVGLGGQTVKLTEINGVVKIAVLRRSISNGVTSVFISVYEMNGNGLLTSLGESLLTNTESSFTSSNIVLSSQQQVGFITGIPSNVQIRLFSFSLNNAAVISSVGGNETNTLTIKERNGRILLASGSINTLNIIDATNPVQMQVTSLTLPSNNASFGSNPMRTAFSEDGNYLFAGNGFSKISVINTNNLQIVSFLNNNDYRPSLIEIVENQNTRLLAIRMFEDGTGNVPKGIAILDASNPNNLTIINQRAYGEETFRIKSIKFSQNGKRLFTLYDDRIETLRVSNLNFIWENRLSPIQGFGGLAFQLLRFGSPERVLAAWNFNGSAQVNSIINRTNRNSNFDLDGKTDIGVYRSGTGIWYWKQSVDGIVGGNQFGLETDQIVPKDYDGDEKTDLAVFRQSEGNWYILQSSDNIARITPFGIIDDKPAPGDYDGDEKADVAVFRPSTGVWYILKSSNGQAQTTRFGIAEDKPTVGDFDGDGKADIAVFRPSTGIWYRLNSSDNSIVISQFGISEDKPVAGDYDGDGKADIAVFRPSTSIWYRINSGNGSVSIINFGIAADKPIVADYDGDGKIDVAVFRPQNRVWYILRSFSNTIQYEQFGLTSDTPTTFINN